MVRGGESQVAFAVRARRCIREKRGARRQGPAATNTVGREVVGASSRDFKLQVTSSLDRQASLPLGGHLFAHPKVAQKDGQRESALLKLRGLPFYQCRSRQIS